MPAPSSTSTIVWFADLGLADIDQVGGKNASLGEMCDPAVKSLISSAISACKSRGRYVGICGQVPVIIPISPSGSRAGDRQHLAQSRHCRRHLDQTRRWCTQIGS